MSVTTTRAEIQEFLAQKRLAIVGVSRESKCFANDLFREFRKRGYNVVPVNPHLEILEGERCFARVPEITPKVDAALLMTSGENTLQAVRDCAAAGVKYVWLYGVGGPGSVDAQALELCKQQGIQVIPGFCPYMFLPGTPFFHRMHGWVMRLTGSAPN